MSFAVRFKLFQRVSKESRTIGEGELCYDTIAQCCHRRDFRARNPIGSLDENTSNNQRDSYHFALPSCQPIGAPSSDRASRVHSNVCCSCFSLPADRPSGRLVVGCLADGMSNRPSEWPSEASTGAGERVGARRGSFTLCSISCVR